MDISNGGAVELSFVVGPPRTIKLPHCHKLFGGITLEVSWRFPVSSNFNPLPNRMFQCEHPGS